MTTTTLRGIPFTTPEVRALQSGAKRQFRLPVKLSRINFASGCSQRDIPRVGSVSIGSDELWRAYLQEFPGVSIGTLAPRFEVGERLFVKEAYWLFNHGNTFRGTGIEYKADGFIDTRTTQPKGRGKLCCWRPSTEMPQWAARYFIEITAVRAQRLQEISWDDLQQETEFPDEVGVLSSQKPYFKYFASDWDSRHKTGERWADNVLVWCYEFEVSQ